MACHPQFHLIDGFVCETFSQSVRNQRLRIIVFIFQDTCGSALPLHGLNDHYVPCDQYGMPYCTNNITGTAQSGLLPPLLLRERCSCRLVCGPRRLDRHRHSCTTCTCALVQLSVQAGVSRALWDSAHRAEYSLASEFYHRGVEAYSHNLCTQEWPVCLLRWRDKNARGKARVLEVVDEFRSFVRPTWRPQLTSFCTTLTGITQVSLAHARVYTATKTDISRATANTGLAANRSKWIAHQPSRRFCRSSEPFSRRTN